MRNKSLIAIYALIAIFGALALSRPSADALITSPGVIDGTTEWRQLTDTKGLDLAVVAAQCPADGLTQCTGDLAGWTWATDEQVIGFIDNYSPDVTLATPFVEGTNYYAPAITMLSAMRSTVWNATTYSSFEGAFGYTATANADGTHHLGSGTDSFFPFYGSLGLQVGSANVSPAVVGIWLFRDASNPIETTTAAPTALPPPPEVTTTLPPPPPPEVTTTLPPPPPPEVTTTLPPPPRPEVTTTTRKPRTRGGRTR